MGMMMYQPTAAGSARSGTKPTMGNMHTVASEIANSVLMAVRATMYAEGE